MIRLLELLQKQPQGCEWNNVCDCKEKREECCDDCTHYRVIDSGYGLCCALPEPVLVAWCRFTCGMFTKHQGVK